jgi:hypothetical protein
MYIGHPEENGTLVEAPAQAWFKQFRVNSSTGRLQGMPRWVGNAKADLVDSGLYKFISAYEWGEVFPDGVFHPATIGSVGLTNNPVKRAGQHPLANATNKGVPAMPKGIDLIGRPNAVSDEIVAMINEIVGDTDNKEEALGRLYAKLQELYDEEDKARAALQIVESMGNACGIALPEGDMQTRCNAVAEAVQAVCMERDGMIIDQAVADGAVQDTETARANAAKLLRADREAAMAHFANAVHAPAHNGQRTTDPVGGENRPKRANAVETTQAEINAAQVSKITARANGICKENGGNWDAAWSRAQREIATEAATE